jgi:hypothetical protein
VQTGSAARRSAAQVPDDQWSQLALWPNTLVFEGVFEGVQTIFDLVGVIFSKRLVC